MDVEIQQTLRQLAVHEGVLADHLIDSAFRKTRAHPGVVKEELGRLVDRGELELTPDRRVRLRELGP
jgi:hypothetical protein